ncbi:transcriptional regulator, AraC family [Fibrisoma limi BUZ 3]|uniref:Transcriptional regulator, AraC family n=1 Tax=Fibrisoma limi BUZ 3 TaxID=1185876 RepID=I2GGG5_9BACT|nr:AraC family transcriptional regulator [Fibrisoma limi]CCH52990.1 transcriptional regulator, AraC family [Fibrisoma limi BUZ 3]
MLICSMPDPLLYNGQPAPLSTNRVMLGRTQEAYCYPSHRTPYLFITNPTNKGEYSINNRPTQIGSRFFYFLNPDDTLEIRFREAISRETLLILFTESFVGGSLRALTASHAAQLDNPVGTIDRYPRWPAIPMPFIDSLQSVLQTLVVSALPSEEVQALLFEVVQNAAVIHDETQRQLSCLQAVRQSTKEELYRRLFHSVDYMQDNVTQPLTVEHMAREVGMNTFHFLATFKSVYQTTPHQFFRELKLQKAIQLLRSGQYTVSDVCYLVGFDSVSSFSLLVKKRFSIPPSAFVKESETQKPNFR